MNLLSIISNESLFNLTGGISISGSLINAFTSGIKTVLEVGRSFGTSIRRIITNNLCHI